MTVNKLDVIENDVDETKAAISNQKDVVDDCKRNLDTAREEIKFLERRLKHQKHKLADAYIAEAKEILKCM